MKHSNISIFIPHQGCKNACSFCNQNTISGAQNPPSLNEVNETLQKASQAMNIKAKADTEIAFFGGSFTAINREYMINLLKVAIKYIGDNGFRGIRVSTRPDAIDEEILLILKQYGVTSIELGAQSMRDEVLQKNNRGHTASDVINAAKLIQKNGFSLGLQMMVGLYGDDAAGAIYTAEKIVEISPRIDTVRIYPTVILKGTKLAELYQSGEYKVFPLDEAVPLCAKLLTLFETNGIKVIKLGLHASNDVEQDMLGGIYHQAFRELCENEIYFNNAVAELKKHTANSYVLYVKVGSISKMVGQKKKNIEKLKDMGYNIRVAEISELKNYEIRVEEV